MGRLYRVKRSRTSRPATRRRPRALRRYRRGVPQALPFRNKMRWRTRYVDKNIQINPASGGIPQSHVFSLNGLYDPDITGVGHQPIGFDELVGTMYDHYTVVSVKATITFSNTDVNYHQLCLLQLKDTNTTSTSTNEIIENGNCKYVTLGRAGSGSDTRVVKMNISPSKFFGRNVMDGDKYQGDVNNNPSDGLFLHLQAGPLEAVDADIVDVTVQLDYIVILTEPKQLGQS